MSSVQDVAVIVSHFRPDDAGQALSERAFLVEALIDEANAEPFDCEVTPER